MILIGKGDDVQWVTSIAGYEGYKKLAELPKGHNPGDYSWDGKKLVETLEQRRRQIWQRAEPIRAALEAKGEHAKVQQLHDKIFDKAATREGLSRVRLPRMPS